MTANRVADVVDMNRYLSEYFGTMGLVFFGTLAIAVSQNSGNLDNVGIGIVFGLVVMTMIYGFGQTSGAHINPAVTLAFWIGKEFPTRDLFPYILFQFLGAASASLMVHYIFPDDPVIGMTVPKTDLTRTFVVEMMLSLFLMTVIFHVSKGTKEIGTLAGIAIGGTVALEAMVGGPLTGASMNPARSFGPALVSGNLDQLWIYFIAPSVGMLLSIPVWNITKLKK